MAKSNKTKAQLEEDITVLKEMVKDLKASLKKKEDANDKVGDNAYVALGLYKNEYNQYFLAEILYNPETKAVKFKNTDFASRVPEALHLAEFNLKKEIQEQIMTKLGV